MSLDRINSLVDQREFARALPLLERALARSPRDVELGALMSYVLTQLGQHARAEHFARRTLEAMPDHAHALHNLGNILTNLGRHEEAVPLLERALELGGEAQTCLALANALFALSRFASVLEVLRRGLEVYPSHFMLRNNLAHTLHACGRIDEALPMLRQLQAEAPEDHGLADAMSSVLNYAPVVSPEEVFAAHVHYGQLIERLVGPVPARDGPSPPPPLHVGLLSSDLREHAVGHLIEDFLEHHDRSRVRVTCYAGPMKEDGMSARLRGYADGWRSLAGKTHAQAAELIRRDGVHVLMDLAGHTKGQMVQVLAHRAAPVQMTYTGYPNTTGLRACDFRIVDSLTDPEGAERWHTERLLRLDPCYMSYRVPRDLPPVRARDGAAPVTFGSFSSLLKVNGPLLALWSRVLAAVPGSRLMLMHTGLTEAAVREDIRARFAGLGIDPARVDPRPPAPTREGVLPAYGELDIALDTFPYNGAVTVVEALLMGVPYVSLAGPTSASRAALSVLTAVGHPELCAASEDEYVRIAVALAGDPSRRAELRGRLRADVLASPICDGPAFARRFEELLERAWTERLRQV